MPLDDSSVVDSLLAATNGLRIASLMTLEIRKCMSGSANIPSELSSLNTTPVAINKKLSIEEKFGLYREMVRIRRFEERAIRSYQEGKIGGFCHTYIGQEAVAVGTLSVLGPEDHIITAYRDHGHALFVGVSMDAAMAELYGKSTGCSKGKGGSMHFFAPDRNFWGGHGIVGGQVPLGVGIGFALKYRAKTSACLCFLGDGAVNQGSVHESFNLSALWNIPVIYIIENNRYSMGTSQERSSAGRSLARRAAGYNITHTTVEGHCIDTVRAATAQALQHAYEQSRPTVLEIQTYRYRGHSMSDPDQTYRDKNEIENYKRSRDPITLYKKLLQKEGVASNAQLKAIDNDAREEAEAAARFAEESPFPENAAILEDVYWENDHPEAKTSRGTLFFNQPPQ